jgi:hypothetical protein
VKPASSTTGVSKRTALPSATPIVTRAPAAIAEHDVLEGDERRIEWVERRDGGRELEREPRRRRVVGRERATPTTGRDSCRRGTSPGAAAAPGATSEG